MSLLLHLDHGTAMRSDFPALDAQDQQWPAAGLFKHATLPQTLVMWLVMHLRGFSGTRDANQPIYINGRKNQCPGNASPISGHNTSELTLKVH